MGDAPGQRREDQPAAYLIIRGETIGGLEANVDRALRDSGASYRVVGEPALELGNARPWFLGLQLVADRGAPLEDEIVFVAQPTHATSEPHETEWQELARNWRELALIVGQPLPRLEPEHRGPWEDRLGLAAAKLLEHADSWPGVSEKAGRVTHVLLEVATREGYVELVAHFENEQRREVLVELPETVTARACTTPAPAPYADDPDKALESPPDEPADDGSAVAFGAPCGRVGAVSQGSKDEAEILAEQSEHDPLQGG